MGFCYKHDDFGPCSGCEQDRRKAILDQKDARIAELEAEVAMLREIGNIAHHGGLRGLGDIYVAMNEIRRITLPYWDKKECNTLQMEPKTWILSYPKYRGVNHLRKEMDTYSKDNNDGEDQETP